MSDDDPLAAARAARHAAEYNLRIVHGVSCPELLAEVRAEAARVLVLLWFARMPFTEAYRRIQTANKGGGSGPRVTPFGRTGFAVTAGPGEAWADVVAEAEAVIRRWAPEVEWPDDPGWWSFVVTIAAGGALSVATTLPAVRLD